MRLEAMLVDVQLKAYIYLKHRQIFDLVNRQN